MKRDEQFSAEAQRFLDGEPGVGARPGERAQAERLAAAVRDLATRAGELDASLDERVMAAVRALPAVRRPSPWRWLVEPRPVRVRPVWAPLAVAAALALWLVPRALAPDRTAAPPEGPAVAAAARDTVYVRFELTAPGAQQVAVAGSFNGWRSDALRMHRGDDGTWSVTIPLALGEYHYQFVVDGQRWVTDPTAHALEDDGFGGRNSVIVVGPKGVVRS